LPINNKSLIEKKKNKKEIFDIFDKDKNKNKNKGIDVLLEKKEISIYSYLLQKLKLLEKSARKIKKKKHKISMFLKISRVYDSNFFSTLHRNCKSEIRLDKKKMIIKTIDDFYIPIIYEILQEKKNQKEIFDEDLNDTTEQEYEYNNRVNDLLDIQSCKSIFKEVLFKQETIKIKKNSIQEEKELKKQKKNEKKNQKIFESTKMLEFDPPSISEKKKGIKRLSTKDLVSIKKEEIIDINHLKKF